MPVLSLVSLPGLEILFGEFAKLDGTVNPAASPRPRSRRPGVSIIRAAPHQNTGVSSVARKPTKDWAATARYWTLDGPTSQQTKTTAERGRLACAF